MKEYNYNIDIIKFVLSILIFYLHLQDGIYPTGILGITRRFTLDWVVSVFFIISGYLLAKNHKVADVNKSKSLNRGIFRNIDLWIMGNVFFTFVVFVATPLIIIAFNLDKTPHTFFIKPLIDNHLWYVEGLIVSYFIYKFCKKDKDILKVIGVSLSIILFMYFSKFVQPLWAYKIRTCTFGVLATFIGIYIGSKDIKLSLNKSKLLFLLGVIGYTIATILEYEFRGNKSYIYFVELIFAVPLFLLLLNLNPIKISKETSNKLKTWSLYLYILHAPIINMGSFLIVGSTTWQTFYIVEILVTFIAVVLMLKINFLEIKPITTIANYINNKKASDS